ncbi:MAG: MFS transporter [Acidobacteriales bacterium]|nr:MFS transporter [Terriglobales bacterium]
MGWALDAFDVMLYAIVVTAVMRDLGLSKGTAGLLNTLTLLASGVGGVVFGAIADRLGRKRALMASILTYSVCSFLSGLATSVLMLAIVRFILGLGMGGEWNTGAALVAETWPEHLRAKAMAVVQSSWGLGYAAAALVGGIVLRITGNWRSVFFVGVAPALVTLWIRKDVPESEMWKSRAVQGSGRAEFSEIFQAPLLWRTLTLLAMNFFGMFAWWGMFTWLPAYLSLPVDQGGRGLDLPLLHANWLPLSTTTVVLVVLNVCGMFPGYACFGWVADRIGRKRAFILYTAIAALLVPIYAAARSPWSIMLLGTLLAFFGTGFFSGSGIIGSEIFPTTLRARGLGFTYNGARTVSSISPFVIGAVSERHGLAGAFLLCGLGFALSAVTAFGIPETRGRRLS